MAVQPAASHKGTNKNMDMGPEKVRTQECAGEGQKQISVPLC
jgi:hypothetical protein